jgi:succinylglutamic semialdehyde dehydrogenase
MKTPQRLYRGNYILGHFIQITDSNGEIVSRNPGDLDAPAIACAFNYEHVHEAVVAAQRGMSAWRRLASSDRLSALAAYRKKLSDRAESVAELICFETGKPLWEAREELSETLAIIDYYLASAQTASNETVSREEGSGFDTRVNHYPRGVVAIVSPGICPVSDAHLHLIPALAHGNAVVFKASRHAPLVGQAIAEIMHDAQVPAGVFNLVQGDAEVARRLVSHADVQVVLYTGSYETGLKVQKQVLSDYWKIVVLDMVGKNGVLIWDDSHYQQALHETIYSAFLTTGQRRTTASRVLVHKSLLERFQRDFHALAKKASVGYGYTPSEQTPFLGPLLNDEAVENYIRYQGIAVREGCEEIMRGKSLERNPKGHYVSPSIHLVTKADPKSVYQKSEIFGPNVALYGVEDLEEAIDVLNLSQHGLVASVYSKTRETFQRACENVRVGTLHWNRPTHTATYRLPRGGLKKSGNSRAMGSLAWQQLTYPVASTEREGGWKLDQLPKSLPSGEAG